MDKILILGSNGFLGKKLVSYFYEHSLDQIYNIFTVTTSNYIFKNISIKNQYLISDLNSIINIIKEIKPQYIINLIGIFKSDSLVEMLEINLGITSKIINYYLDSKQDLKNLLLIGSSAEYGEVKKLPIQEDASLNPINFYGLSKKYQTELSLLSYKKYNININIARIFNLIGQGVSDKLAPGRFLKLINEAENGSTIKVGNLSSIRDYIEINIALKYLVCILFNGVPGEVYNVCSGNGIKMKDLLLQMIFESKKLIYVNVDECLYDAGEVNVIVGDNSKILKLMNT